MATIPYSDNVKSIIGGTLFTLGVGGLLGYNHYVLSEKNRIYDKIDKAISALDGRPENTSLADWAITYQRALGRELRLGEHPKESDLIELEIIEGNLEAIISNSITLQIK